MTTNRIEMNPKVMMGKPVIRGTRIPRLTKADIQAAIGYAAAPRDRFRPDNAVF
jgi:uncharacterized protein (DUF433 family)